MDISAPFHTQTNSYSEQIIEIIKNVLRVYVVIFGNKYLWLVELHTKKYYHSSIELAPIETLYDRRCGSLDGWYSALKVRSWGTYLVRESLDNIKFIEDRFLMDSSRQESYSNQKIHYLELIIEERVLLRVTAMKILLKFNKHKLSLRYIVYVEIDQCIGEVDSIFFVT